MSTETALAIVGIPVALLSALVALRGLWKAAVRFVAFTNALEYLVTRVDQIDKLLNHELRHNHGSSIKDDVVGTAVSVGNTNRRLEDLQDQITELRNERTEP